MSRVTQQPPAGAARSQASSSHSHAPERLQAIILRRTDYGEADRIIQCITPRGQRSAIAKGVRRPRSKLAGGIEPLATNELILRRGRGQLQVVGSARMQVYYRRILADYDRLSFAYEALALVRRGVAMVDEPAWFGLTQQLLVALDDGMPLALTKAWFYVRYMVALGQELSAWHDVNGQALQPGQHYRYSAQERGLAPSPHGSIGAGHIKLLRLMGQYDIAAVAQVGGTEDYLADVLALAQHHAATV